MNNQLIYWSLHISVKNFITWLTKTNEFFTHEKSFFLNCNLLGLLGFFFNSVKHSFPLYQPLFIFFFIKNTTEGMNGNISHIVHFVNCCFSSHVTHCTTYRINLQSSSLLVNFHLSMSTTLFSIVHKFSVRLWLSEQTRYFTKRLWNAFLLSYSLVLIVECDNAWMYIKIIFWKAFDTILKHC